MSACSTPSSNDADHGRDNGDLFMRYIGRLSGEGTVLCEGMTSGRVSFDFDGFSNGGRPAGIVSSGEIRLSRDDLAAAFAHRKVQLLTDEGRHLTLTFSDKALRANADSAHVDVSGELPADPSYWRH